MDKCVGLQLHEVEVQLNVALSQQERGASRGFVLAATGAQAAFGSYEKAECAVAAPNLGGSIYPLLLGDCELRLTVQRLQEVREDPLAGVSGGRG